MDFDDQYQKDLRLLSFLHAMRDKEGFVDLVINLKESQTIDDSTWQHICDMGRELVPEHTLFRVTKTLGQRRQERQERRANVDRRAQERRTNVDRRKLDRRTAALHWLGSDNRKVQRRQNTRRQGDSVHVY